MILFFEARAPAIYGNYFTYTYRVTLGYFTDSEFFIHEDVFENYVCDE